MHPAAQAVVRRRRRRPSTVMAGALKPDGCGVRTEAQGCSPAPVTAVWAHRIPPPSRPPTPPHPHTQKKQTRNATTTPQPHPLPSPGPAGWAGALHPAGRRRQQDPQRAQLPDRRLPVGGHLLNTQWAQQGRPEAAAAAQQAAEASQCPVLSACCVTWLGHAHQRCFAHCGRPVKLDSETTVDGMNRH